MLTDDPGADVRPLVVGLTGGMGAGKSSVARLLAAHGAAVVDADVVAREVVEPGEPALAAIAAHFGEQVLRDDGSLDRAAVAAIVFADDDALDALEGITHPAIRDRIDERVAALVASFRRTGSPAVVVVDHPLLVESGLASEVDVVVVVEAPVELRLARLEQGRGIDPEDARARMARQADDDQRRAVADHVVVNDRDEQHLGATVERLWSTLSGRGPAAPDAQ